MQLWGRRGTGLPLGIVGLARALRKRCRFITVLRRADELRSVLDASVGPVLESARYKIGDLLQSTNHGAGPRNFKVYGAQAGGCAVIYIVLDEETLKPFCLKAAFDQAYAGPDAVARFEREAETWLSLEKHANLIYAHSVLRIGGRLYLLIEYAAGSDLWRKLKQGPLPVAAALRYAIHLCDGMSYAVQVLPGFVHGDLKPNNCLLTKDDVLKISDFGQAAAAEPQASLAEWRIDKGAEKSDGSTPGIKRWRFGTPAYMAPEQFDATHHLDGRSDVYAFGVILFEMLTGQRPFTGTTHPECYKQHFLLAPPDPRTLRADIPEPVAAFILNCLAKSPAERPADFGVIGRKLRVHYEEMCHADIPRPLPAALSAQDLIERGEALLALGRYAEAQTQINRWQANMLQSSGAWSLKGCALAAEGDDAALACFDRALALDAHSALIWHHKGAALAQRASFDEAVACFDRALRLDRKLGCAWLSKGQALIKAGQHEAALECLRVAVQLDEQNAESYNSLGLVYSGLGQGAEALKAHERASQLNPYYADAFDSLGELHLRAGRIMDAVEAYQRALSLRPDLRTARAGLKATCRALLAVSARPVEAKLAETLIAFLTEQPRTDVETVAHCLSMLHAFDYDPTVLYLCGEFIYQQLAWLERREREALIRPLAEVRRRLDPVRHDAKHLYRLGKIYYGLGMDDECLDIFNRLIALHGPDDKSLYYLAACNEVKGRYEAALSHYKAARSFDPLCPLIRAGIKRMKVKLADSATAAIRPENGGENETPFHEFRPARAQGADGAFTSKDAIHAQQ